MWEMIKGPSGGTCGSRHNLVRTGYAIQHCGHPTANYPYYGETPDGEMILDSNGHAFKYLIDAKRAIVKIVTGAATEVDSYEETNIDSDCP